MARWSVQCRRGRYLVLDTGVQVAACSDRRTAEALVSALFLRAEASLVEALEGAGELATDGSVPRWTESSIHKVIAVPECTGTFEVSRVTR